MTDETFDVFISHAFEDHDMALKIAEKCRMRGLKTWLADWYLKPGDDWRSKMATIDHAIDRSNLCVVLLSGATSPHSPWISREWSAIQQNIWEKSNFKVLPVQLDEEVILPAFLREWQRLIATDRDEDAERTGDEVANLIVKGYIGQLEQKDETATKERFRLLTDVIDRLASDEGEEL